MITPTNITKTLNTNKRCELLSSRKLKKNERGMAQTPQLRLAVYQLVHFQELGTMLVTKFSESGAEPFREPWLNINLLKLNALSIWFVT